MEEEKNIEVAEGDNDKLCATSRKDSNSRCSSASKSLKSVVLLHIVVFTSLKVILSSSS